MVGNGDPEGQAETTSDNLLKEIAIGRFHGRSVDNDSVLERGGHAGELPSGRAQQSWCHPQDYLGQSILSLEIKIDGKNTPSFPDTLVVTYCMPSADFSLHVFFAPQENGIVYDK
ncbi:MAG: hypothetical protein ACYCT2_09555 [Thermoplasmataceae archaeon]